MAERRIALIGQTVKVTWESPSFLHWANFLKP